MWFRAKTKERRAAPRVAATGDVHITWEADGQPRQSLGQCADLSARGVRIVGIRDSIPVATEVHLRFLAIDLAADGVVSNAQGTGSIGVRFTLLTLFGSPVRQLGVPADRRTMKILAGASLLFCIGILAWNYFNTGSVWTLIVPWRPAPYTAAAFSLGSTKAEVRAAQGAPSGVSGNSWVYGSSSVFFEGDRVVGWKGMPDFDLKVRFDSPNTTKRGQDYFEVGASASEVVAVQGVPTEVKRNVWLYGSSQVYFRDGRVVGWKNSPQRPLKVHGAPTSP